jgi:hypothetical protein
MAYEYNDELSEYRREQAYLRDEADNGRLDLLRASNGDEDDENEGDGEDAATGRVSGYLPDDTYDEDDDDLDIELDDTESEPSPDLTDDDVLEMPEIPETPETPDPVLLSAEDLDTVASEQSIADATSTSTSHSTVEAPSLTPAAKPKAKKKSKSVRKPKPVRVSKSGVKRPPAKPKKGKSSKGKK